MIPAGLFFFVKIRLAVLGPVPFHINFRLNLSMPTKNLAGILIKKFFKPVYQFGKNGHVYYVKSSNP